jgi:hypothetical protein
MIIPLVGCSKKDDTTTPKVTPRTPIQLVNDRVNASDTINTRQDTDLQNHASRIGTLETNSVNLAPLTARVTALEALNISDLVAQFAFLNARLSSLESYNISTRLETLENLSHEITDIIGSYNVSQLLTIFHNLLNLSTNESVPTPSVGNHDPIINNITYDNLSESPYYAVLFCNASDQDSDVLSYTWFINTSSFINNGHSRVYWIPPVAWNGSPTSISVIVSDGRGGTGNFTRPISH